MTRRYAPYYPSPSIEPMLTAMAVASYMEKRLFLANGNYPRFLYRYISFNPDEEKSIDRLRDIVVRSELWLSSIHDFNDPFDMAAHIKFEGTTEEKKNFLNQMYRNTPQLEKVKWKEKQKKINELMANPNLPEQLFRNGYQKNMDLIGVCCFTLDPRNILMWSHYSSNHTGLVLQFEAARHIEVLARPLQIGYSKNYPIINWLNKEDVEVENILLRKHIGWEYEQEWRIIHPWGARSYLQYHPSGLRGIILGCRAESQSVKKLKDLLTERERLGHSMPQIYRAHKHPRDYNLIIKREN